MYKRQVLEPVVLVIAGVIPIDMLALERKHLFERSEEIGRDTAKHKANLLSHQIHYQQIHIVSLKFFPRLADRIECNSLIR